jgi:signal transduction histidine kinase
MAGNLFESQYLLIVITIIIIILCIGTIFFFWYYHNLLLKLHETIIQKQNETEINTKKEIAYILHEEISKTLTFISWNIKKLQGLLHELEQDADIFEAFDYCDAANKHILSATERVKHLHHHIYPPSLQVLNFDEACTILMEENQKLFNGKVEYEFNNTFDKLKPSDKFNLYGLINLFTTNSIKHSNADKIEVKLTQKDNFIELSLIDNGTGFNIKEAEKKATGRGIFDIKSRAIALLPTFFIFESDKAGTKLQLTLEINHGE